MITVQNPKYSFIQFGPPLQSVACCDGTESFSLPFVEETDVYFQLKMTAETYAEASALFDTPLSDFRILLLKGGTNTVSTFWWNIMRDWTTDDNLVFEKYRVSATEVVYLWKNPFKYIDQFIGCGECFQIAFANGDVSPGQFNDDFNYDFDLFHPGSGYLLLSNSLVRKCNDCHTTVLEYSNDEDNYGFNYCNIPNPVNRVRMPLYLSQPQFPIKKTVYRKSNGVLKTVNSVLDKEYQGKVDYIPEHIHEKLVIALEHDHVNTITGKYVGEINTSSYDIEWNDELCLAQAKFKAAISPFSIRNNNCDDCGTWLCPITISDIEVTLLEASPGHGYSYHAAWSISDLPYLISIPEYSLDNGLTWVPVDNYSFNSSFTECDYLIELEQEEDLSHLIRFIPECDATHPGSAFSASYGAVITCNQPTGLYVNIYAEYGKITATWSNSPHPSGGHQYELIRTDTNTVVSSGTHASTSYSLTLTAAPSVPHKFRVKALCGSAGESAWTEQTFTPPGKASGVVSCENALTLDSLFHLGVPSTVSITSFLTSVSVAGFVNITIRSIATGTISGFRMYGYKSIYVTPSTSYVWFTMNVAYDGSGTAGVMPTVIEFDGNSGLTDECSNDLWIDP